MKENHEMKQHGNKCFARRPLPDPHPHPLDPGFGVKKAIFNLLEYGHVACRIKEFHKCSRMVANILPADPPWPWGWGHYVKIQLFLNRVMLHIKLKGFTKCISMVANILPADPSWPCCWGQQDTIQLFQNTVMLHIKFKGITNAAAW